MTIAGLLLAAGMGTRFGGDKLVAPFRRGMLGEHAALALAAVTDRRVAVCAAGSSLAAALEALGYRIMMNVRPEKGLSHSLAIGLAALDDAGAALVVLADMPNVTAAHLRALVAAFDGRAIIASGANGRRSPPAILPRDIWPALTVQSGDQGARPWLTKAQTIACPPEMLADVDTIGDLDQLARQRLPITLSGKSLPNTR
ncbi:MAG: nucleotidyltransferase family protein [Sphingomonadaceae bacterium]